MTRPTLGLIVMLVLTLTGSGCANKMAQQAARSASDQVGALETALAAKIVAENRYYEGIERMTVEDLERDRLDRMQIQMTSLSRNFASKHGGASTTDTFAEKLTDYAVSFATAWKERETALQTGIETRREELGKSRQALAVEAAKLQKLRAKLRVLGESRDWKDLFKFLVKFGKETKRHLDDQQDAAENTSS